jgi:predicted aspartyl protease
MATVELSWPADDLQQDGPWMWISITNPKMELEEARSVGLEFPKPLRMKALVDTGASLTVINPEVAKTWKLRQTGFAKIVAAGSSGTYAEHAAAIEFPDTNLRGFDPIRVVACPIVGQWFSCLIGRDILRRWHVSYDGRSGHVRIEE